jgi:hypothetical protein
MTLMTPSVCVFDVQHGFSTLNANFGAIFTAKYWAFRWKKRNFAKLKLSFNATD